MTSFSFARARALCVYIRQSTLACVITYTYIYIYIYIYIYVVYIARTSLVYKVDQIFFIQEKLCMFWLYETRWWQNFISLSRPYTSYWTWTHDLSLIISLWLQGLSSLQVIRCNFLLLYIYLLLKIIRAILVIISHYPYENPSVTLNRYIMYITNLLDY